MSATNRGLDQIVVVGGGMSGGRTCEHLRRLGYAGAITLVASELHPPYDRPPLSKAVLRRERDETVFELDLEALGVTALFGRAATGLDVDAARVQVASGGGRSTQALPYDGLVIATGSAPIVLAGGGEQMVLRTIDDALQLREHLVPGARVVILGASWIGAEVATVAVERGCTVTCVDADDAPAGRVFGPAIGARFLPWWTGVELRLGTPVEAVMDGCVVLADGTALQADVVVSGVGVRPETGWLAGSGLPLDGGVVVDEWLRAAPDVVAVGDVAAWWSRRYATRMRVRHWDDAATAPAVAASTLLAPEGWTADSPDAPPVHDPVPYFWSDQFGHKIQYLGHSASTAIPIVRDPADGTGWGAAWLDESGRLSAYLAVDCPRDLVAARRIMASDVTPDLARLADPALALAQVLTGA